MTEQPGAVTVHARLWRLARAAAIGGTTLVAAPVAVEAQWAQGAAGKVWIKSAAYWQRTNEEFGLLGRRQEYIGEGVSDARALYTDVIVGLGRRLDVWLQIPFFDLRYSEIVQDVQTVGFGDIRAWFRWQVASLHAGQTPIAIRVGAKAPIGDSPLDAQIIPLGEGQWDVEVFGEIGHSFWPAPAYAEVWIGFRQRFSNTERFTNPGEELVYLLEAGLQPTSSTLVKTTLDGLWGLRWKADGFVTATRRRLTTLQLAAAVRAGPLWPEAGIRLPFSGRGAPAGTQFIVGLSTQIR